MRTLAVIRVCGFTAAAGEGALWVLDQGDGRVGRVVAVDPRTNSVVGKPIRVAP